MNHGSEEFTGNLLMGFSIALLAVFFIGLVWRAKIKKTSMEEYFAHFIMGNLLMLIILCNIFSFVTEASIATLVHPPEEAVISIIAKFLQHNVISVVGFLCACVAPFFLMMTVQGTQFFSPLKNEHGKVLRKSKPAAFFLLAAMSIVLLFATFYISWGNCALIAKGFKQVREFNYAVERFFFFWDSPQVIAARYGFDPNREVSDYLGFNMNNSFLLLKVHAITSVLEGLMIAILSVVMGEPTIIDKMNQKLIDRDREERVKSAAANPKPEVKPAAGTAPETSGIREVPDTRLPEEKKAEELGMRKRLLKACRLTDAETSEFEKIIDDKQKVMGPVQFAPIMNTMNELIKRLDVAEAKTGRDKDSAILQVEQLFRALCNDPAKLGIDLPKS